MKKIKYLLVLSLFAMLGTAAVYADDEAEEYITSTDNDKYTIVATVAYSEYGLPGLQITLGGTGYTEDDDTSYYVYFADEGETYPTIEVDGGGCRFSTTADSDDLSTFKGVNSQGKIRVGDLWYMLKNRVDAYMADASNSGAFQELQNNIIGFSSFNAFIRQQIKDEKLLVFPLILMY